LDLGRVVARIRERRARRQEEEWERNRADARALVEALPNELRTKAEPAMAAILDARVDGAELDRALDQLHDALAPQPELRDEFFRLRIVDDAVESLK
jgi:hypothetical protein